MEPPGQLGLRAGVCLFSVQLRALCDRFPAIPHRMPVARGTDPDDGVYGPVRDAAVVDRPRVHLCDRRREVRCATTWACTAPGSGPPLTGSGHNVSVNPRNSAAGDARTPGTEIRLDSDAARAPHLTAADLALAYGASEEEWTANAIDLLGQTSSLVIMTNWEVRPASTTDVEVVAELRATVLRADLERLGRYDEQRVRQRLRDGFTPAHTWVIEVDGVFAGCVSLRPAEDAHWLEHFYLAPHLQSRGIGAAVLSRLLRKCDRDGSLVRLNVLQGSPARRLYERHGFTLEAEDPVDVFMVRKPA